MPLSVPGTLHLCSDPWPATQLTAFEFFPSLSSCPSKNLVLHIGGLGDTYLGVPYLPKLAAALSAEGWGLAQCSLKSAGHAWGGSNVKEDAEGLAQIARFFVETQGKEKIVLMGFSTGSSSLSFASFHKRSPFSPHNSQEPKTQSPTSTSSAPLPSPPSPE
jgi:hypothetical protein